MNPPFEVTSPLWWIRARQKPEGWILANRNKLKDGKYAAIIFFDGSGDDVIEKRKENFAEFMQKHGQDVKSALNLQNCV